MAIFHTPILGTAALYIFNSCLDKGLILYPAGDHGQTDGHEQATKQQHPRSLLSGRQAPF